MYGSLPSPISVKTTELSSNSFAKALSSLGLTYTSSRFRTRAKPTHHKSGPDQSRVPIMAGFRHGRGLGQCPAQEVGLGFERHARKRVAELHPWPLGPRTRLALCPFEQIRRQRTAVVPTPRHVLKLTAMEEVRARVVSRSKSCRGSC